MMRWMKLRRLKQRLVLVDINERKPVVGLEKPSDHAPVIIDLAEYSTSNDMQMSVLQ